jgi:uncharacterized protein (DUF342 family)
MEGLVFQISADGTKLQAVYTPSAGNSSIDEGSIKKTLDAKGFSNLYLFDNACAELAKQICAATEHFTMDVGEKRDGAFSLNISPDSMTVFLTITPPYGGRAVTSDEICNALKEKGIVSGIQHEAIKEATSACRALNKPIALGRPPLRGNDGQLLSLIPEMKEHCPHQDDDSSVIDYRDLGGIVNVKAGDPLMRRIPAEEGTPGENVKGEPVPGIPGNDVRFAAELSGTELSTDDSDLLIAAIGGKPVIVSNGVIVEPTVNIKNVDMSTGNLAFEGTIIVSGDIAAGMEVKASGDIIIGGMVEDAMLEAKGNVEVKGGIIFAKVHAKGSITARFAEKAHLHAAGNIVLRELSMQSELKAGGRIVVGEQGMKMGHIIGGVSRATTLVHAMVLGSSAGVATRIEVGVDPDAKERLSEVRLQLDKKQKEAEEIAKTLAYVKQNPLCLDPATVRLKEKTSIHLQSEIAELTGQKKRLQKRLESVDHAGIEVERTVHDGVKVAIGDKALSVDDELENVTFHIEEDAIVY